MKLLMQGQLDNLHRVSTNKQPLKMELMLLAFMIMFIFITPIIQSY